MGFDYVITGACGFIGYHLCEYLLLRGRRVLGLDNLSAARSVDRLQRLRTLSGFTFSETTVGGRPRLPARLTKSCHNSRWVHLAALSSARFSQVTLRRYLDVNVGGTRWALEEAFEAGAARAVVVSSSSVYGQLLGHANAEDDPLMPTSKYGHSKVGQEAVAAEFSEQGADVGVVRPFSVYGPWLRPDLFIARVLHAALFTRLPIQVYRQPSPVRDFTFVGDVVAWIVTMASMVGHFGPVNLGTGSSWTVDELVSRIECELGRAVPVTALPAPSTEILATRADVSRRCSLGMQGGISLPGGLAITIEWVIGSSGPAAPSRFLR